jgi:Ferredoxin
VENDQPCPNFAWASAAGRANGSNLLDALNEAGLNVPYSCRAGSCHACLVHCLGGQPLDAMPEALAQDKHAQGWRLACQCRVVEDLRVALFDPQQDGVPAQVCALDWFGDVLRVRLRPERAMRYQAGQHVVLWNGAVARPLLLWPACRAKMISSSFISTASAPAPFVTRPVACSWV